MNKTTRRRFIATGASISAIAVAGCGEEDPDPDPEPEPEPETEPEPEPEPEDEAEPFEANHEIWAADQGTNTIYIYEPADEDAQEFELLDEIDTGAEGGEVPHMVSYTSDYEYAAIACTAGARTLVYRTEDRELVGNIETGAGSHFAGFTPDDDAIVVDVIGESEIVKVDADLDDEEFEIESTIEVGEEIEGLTEQEGAPICHSYDHQGRSIHTLGPSYNNAGLLIVDHDDFDVDVAFNGDELPTNCGTMPHPTENKFYLTAGLPSDPDAGDDGVGDYYVLDTETDEILVDGESTRGNDAHGFWFTPDAEELWILNRETNDGVIVDPETDEVIEEIDAFGPAQSDDPGERDSPDIFWGSPDGQYMYTTLRGSNPVSGDPHAATGVNSGFSVIDIESREIANTVLPDEESEDSDFHGIGIRPTEEFDGFTSPPF